MIVADLLRESYFTAHVIREGGEMSGFRATQGLQFLNEIISKWSRIGIYIPFNVTTILNVEANVYLYTVNPPMAELDEAKLIVSTNVQYPLQIVDTHLFNLFNYNFPVSIPNSIYLSREQAFDENNNPVSNIYIYPTPDQAYTIQIIQKQSLQQVTLFQNLDISALPPSIYRTLRYQMASDLRDVYGTELPPSFDMQLQEMLAEMMALNPSDNSIQTKDPFHTQRRFKPWGYGPTAQGGI